MISLFITYRLKGRLDGLLALPPDWGQRLPQVQGLRKVLLHQPGRVDDPFLSHEPEPPAEYVLQFYFDELFSLEAACARQAGLSGLLSGLEASLGPVQAKSQQAMVVRAVPVAGQAPDAGGGADSAVCTYLVAYYGSGQDHDQWLSDYMASHVPLMGRMPGVRQVEIYTRLDWLSGLDLPKGSAIQRNKVVFDSVAGLQAALQSPIRAEMRADYLSLPQIGQTNTHEAMRTDCVFGGARPLAGKPG